MKRALGDQALFIVNALSARGLYAELRFRAIVEGGKSANRSFKRAPQLCGLPYAGLEPYVFDDEDAGFAIRRGLYPPYEIAAPKNGQGTALYQ